MLALLLRRNCYSKVKGMSCMQLPRSCEAYGISYMIYHISLGYRVEDVLECQTWQRSLWAARRSSSSFRRAARASRCSVSSFRAAKLAALSEKTTGQLQASTHALCIHQYQCSDQQLAAGGAVKPRQVRRDGRRQRAVRNACTMRVWRLRWALSEATRFVFEQHLLPSLTALTGHVDTHTILEA